MRRHVRSRRQHLSFLLLSTLVCGASTLSAQKPAPKTYTVSIHNMQFTPRTLTVASGDTVQWTNKDIVPHDVVSPDHVLSSPELRPHQTWKHVLVKTGTIPYICDLHPNMHGTIVVK